MQEGTRTPLLGDQMHNSSSENWFDRRCHSAESENQHGKGPKGPVPRRFQYSEERDSLQPCIFQKRQSMEPAGMPSKHRSEPGTHNNKTNRKSTYATKKVKGYTANRPPPKAKDIHKSWDANSSTFEVKLSDFPELCDVTPSTHKPPLGQEIKTVWGSVKSATIQDSPAAVIKHQSVNKGPKPKSSQQVTIEKSENSSSAIPSHVLSKTYGSPATSWANIASQPPKVIPKISTAHEESSQVDAGQQQTEQKKKRKKKKKCKTAGETMEEEEADNVPVQQMPPKIEDDEEFPDLSFSLAHPNRETSRQTSNPGIQENIANLNKGASLLQSENKNASKIAYGQAVSSTPKKGQMSQKKSKALVQLDLGNVLTVLEQKQSKKSNQDVKSLTLSVGGALPIVHKESITQKKLPWQQERVAHNPLDSTSPLVKKGKQREVPKAKKPSPLKRVILKEREERKQNRLLEEMDPARVTNQVSQVEQVSPASESSAEISSAQSCHEPTSNNDEQSSAETDEHIESHSCIRDESTEENTPSKEWSLNSGLNQPKIHSRKFRDYCSQMLSKDVDECVTTLLKELVRFQDRLYQKDPMKARMKRRLVMGLREVLKHLKLRKVKCVIISPNCERVQSKGGLDEALHAIIDTCREQSVPFVFALSRKSLGRCVNKAVPVSLVGIFNYDGAQDHYHKMIELTSQARKAYEVMVANLEVDSKEQPEDEGEIQQDADPPTETTVIEDPEYIKIWKRVLEKDYSHKFLPFEEQFSSMAIGTDVATSLDYNNGS